MIITLRDDKKEFPIGSTPADIARSISDGLFRASLVAKVNGKVVGMYDPINEDATVELLTFDTEEGKRAYRHSCSHVLAQAVKRIYPTVRVAIGPAIDNGFYYDFDFITPINMDAIPAIEAEMKKIIKENLPIIKEEVTRAYALEYFQNQGEIYKVELINDLPEDAVITMYRQGEFVDLCAGPHVPATGYI
ncbi:MAG: TGS domain-containing protein, partial [Clostridia bacterium]|nr:TGS domain-containing protein [Clostridia bacterium]